MDIWVLVGSISLSGELPSCILPCILTKDNIPLSIPSLVNVASLQYP